MRRRAEVLPAPIQGPWWNWNICEGAFGSTDGSCAPQDQVPEGWLFLAGSNRMGCKDPPLERICEVPAGDYKVLIPIVNVICEDYEDDKDADCHGTREECADSAAIVEPKSSYDEFFFKIDGVVSPQDVFYLYYEDKFYTEDCLNKEKCCDPCDKPECEKCGGVDHYPSFGWWGYEERTLEVGNTYTYEIGANLKKIGFCPAVKYILTAV